MVLCAGVFWARIEQMHISWLSLKQETYVNLVWLWACWADMGCYNDRCQEYEGKLGFVRDVGDTKLISSAAQRTVSLRSFICSSVPETVPLVTGFQSTDNHTWTAN